MEETKEKICTKIRPKELISRPTRLHQHMPGTDATGRIDPGAREMRGPHNRGAPARRMGQVEGSREAPLIVLTRKSMRRHKCFEDVDGGTVLRYVRGNESYKLITRNIRCNAIDVICLLAIYTERKKE